MSFLLPSKEHSSLVRFSGFDLRVRCATAHLLVTRSNTIIAIAHRRERERRTRVSSSQTLELVAAIVTTIHLISAASINLLRSSEGASIDAFPNLLMKVPRVEAKLRVFSFKIQFGTQWPSSCHYVDWKHLRFGKTKERNHYSNFLSNAFFSPSGLQMYRTVKIIDRAAASSGTWQHELDQESEIPSPKELESRYFEANNREG
ncbi:hypothetical protein Ahy_A10g049534 isoform A [Arachis hypogaea]|uniref:Uncharacterized protein n=1 Tax=Arachis hypogaea TaxID=3818 RepID=A0A445B7D8_ARAHY|nr:hypothetical protein Ahy_A10g049534 isoform A [Arachis hypogaea]